MGNKSDEGWENPYRVRALVHIVRDEEIPAELEKKMQEFDNQHLQEQKKRMCEEKYVGKIIELTEPIDDPYTPKTKGSRFYVDSVDDILQLHGYWLDGGSMAVDVEVDKFIIVE